MLFILANFILAISKYFKNNKLKDAVIEWLWRKMWSPLSILFVQTKMWILEPGFVNYTMKYYTGHLSYFKVPWISLLPSDIQMDRKGCADGVLNEDYFIVCFFVGGGRGEDRDIRNVILSYMLECLDTKKQAKMRTFYLNKTSLISIFININSLINKPLTYI